MDPSLAELLERIKTPSFRKRKEARRQAQLSKFRRRSRHKAGRQRNVHPERVGARAAVAWAIKRGEIVRPDRCDMARAGGCDGPIKPWHWHGFDRAHQLDVQWLCQRHLAGVDQFTPLPAIL